MGIYKMFSLDCDGCEADLTDSDGIRTGSEQSIIDHACMNGWEYRYCPEGWYCPVCVSKKFRKPAPGPSGAGEGER